MDPYDKPTFDDCKDLDLAENELSNVSASLQPLEQLQGLETRIFLSGKKSPHYRKVRQIPTLMLGQI